jgi:hypothetical protein
MDVQGDVAWNQGHILMAQKSTGRWAVDVEQEGRYRFCLRRWPEELGLAINEEAPAAEAARIPYTEDDVSVAVGAVSARLGLFDQEWRAPVAEALEEVRFEVALSRTGATELNAWFADPTGEERGAYYVTVERLGSP